MDCTVNTTGGGGGLNWTQPALGLIGAMSIVVNGFLCIVILKNRHMLMSSYNVMIFTLAVTDTVTGVFVIASPTLVLGTNNVPVPAGIAGDLFCRIINRGFFVWVFAKFSISIITCMAIERWFAIARPLRYKVVFSRRRVALYIFLMYVWCIAWVFQILFEARMEVKCGVPTCVFKQLIQNVRMAHAFVIMYCTLTVFVPMVITFATFVHLRSVIKKHRYAANQTTEDAKQIEVEIKLSRMSAYVALCIGVCFMPNQVVYIMTKFEVHSYDSELNLAFVVLAMCNSCINPWIYAFTNDTYRKLIINTLCPWRKGGTTADQIGFDGTTVFSSATPMEMKPII